MSRPTYHAVVIADGGPGGLMTDVLFAEKLPFDIEVVFLAGVDESRLDEAREYDEDIGVVVNQYGNNDPEGWLWEGDSVGGVSDDNAMAKSIFKLEEETA